MAKAKQTYSELLRDPRWQKKRLEVMGRDGFTCQRCGSKDKTLNVHHKYYEPGMNPWEYATETMVTLCDECHQVWQEKMTALLREIGLVKSPEGLDQIRGYIWSARRLWRPEAGDSVAIENLSHYGGIMDGAKLAENVLPICDSKKITTQELRDVGGGRCRLVPGNVFAAFPESESNGRGK